MQSNGEAEALKRVYYVRGSGFFAVPAERMNEIPRLRAEHHERETNNSMAMARFRRMM